MAEIKNVIKKSIHGQYLILWIDEAIANEVVESLRQAVMNAFDEGYDKIVLEMNSVNFIESKGLEVILDLIEESQKRGAALKIANPSHICEDIFRTTRLATQLDIYSDIESAKRSFI
ncbi:MAG: anti-sigma factor antagonist [Candidatus Schekmanbacteria bacterium]|nr:MAG: anti-sigma factor antagonist [Candidatus Schekmanbacteria bacterium]